uniref:PEGA domain-containing protein n=1 Tax=Mesocestoides corti TaxID=53468 RepID=A0A5K3FNN3_MESCO
VVARNYGEFKDANGSTVVHVENGIPYGVFEVPTHFSVTVYGPRSRAMSEAMTQILEISITPTIVNSATVTVEMTSDAFFEGVYPA